MELSKSTQSSQLAAMLLEEKLYLEQFCCMAEPLPMAETAIEVQAALDADIARQINLIDK